MKEKKIYIKVHGRHPNYREVSQSGNLVQDKYSTAYVFSWVQGLERLKKKKKVLQII